MDVSPRQLKIFLVENHQDTLTYLGRYLEQKGHEVATARDMQSALARLPQTRADVLICDIGLPDGDGWELLQKVSSKPPFAIAMSGYGTASECEKSRAVGYRHHLIKPFVPEELDALLEEAARSS